MAGEGALVPYSWNGRTMRNGNPYLSPVRTNVGQTCFYRALCDCLDARARLLAENEGLHFEGRFSVQRILEMEKHFLTDRTKGARECLAYLREHPLPIIYAPNNELNFSIRGYDRLVINEESPVRIRDIVRIEGPIIGSHAICDNYPNTTRAYRTDTKKINGEPGDMVMPLRVDDTVAKTPPSEGFQPIVANENPPTPPTPPRKHAVCIVGYDKEKDEEVYEVQDNQGRNFGNGGFRFVTRSSMLKAYVVDLQLDRP